MGKVNLTINDELEREFREVAYREKGMKKGFLTDAIEEAIRVWLEYVKSKETDKGKVMHGLLNIMSTPSSTPSTSGSGTTTPTVTQKSTHADKSTRLRKK
jgi:hypothetical protein